MGTKIFSDTKPLISFVYFSEQHSLPFYTNKKIKRNV